MSSEYLLELPRNGYSPQAGGVGAKIEFNQLIAQLKSMEVMGEKEVVSQINICDDGIVFYFMNKEEK